MNIYRYCRRLRVQVALGALLLSGISIAAADSAPTPAELANASYAGVEEQRVTLSDGRWQGQPYVEGGASRPVVGLVDGFRLSGGLAGNGREQAVVMLWQSGGGSGVFSYLAVVGRAGGEVKNLATAPIGDRVQLRAGRINAGQIELELVQQGAEDAACCPSELVTRRWTLQGGSLHEGKPTSDGRLSLALLDGTEWQLQALNGEALQGVKQAPSLRFDGGRISGFGGCNRYSADALPDSTAGAFSVGPVMGTRMACPMPEMGLETRYLQALGQVTRYQFMVGKLLLSGIEGGDTSQLLYVPLQAE